MKEKEIQSIVNKYFFRATLYLGGLFLFLIFLDYYLLQNLHEVSVDSSIKSGFWNPRSSTLISSTMAALIGSMFTLGLVRHYLSKILSEILRLKSEPV